MSLQKYWQKRDFSITSEPRGEEITSTGELHYFIQRHHASRLHYDFRLELDGTLKSWAVPKGPSFNPSDKRLAVHVEDHPLDYGTFEGDIPEHQYGAGHVVLWDQGTWTPMGDAADGYKKGNLKFLLQGHKLQGKWALVRMQKASRDEGKDNWLLIKEKDEFASAGPDANITELRPESVKGLSLERPASRPDKATQKPASPGKGGPPAKAAAKRTSRAKNDNAASGLIVPTLAATSVPMPKAITPQLATLSQQAPQGDAWISEVKYDGYRALSRIDHGKVGIYTRGGNDWTAKWPQIRDALSQLAIDQAWLDGEVVALQEDGSISFQALQNFMEMKKQSAKKRPLARLAYYVFDLLYLNGQDISELPLTDRKLLLKQLLDSLPPDSPILYSDHTVGNADAVYKDACKHGLEGIVAKQADAAYYHGRSTAWLKVKCALQQEFVIGGYTDPEGSRQGFGALLLGVYDDAGKLVYTGRVGTGFDGATLNAVMAKLKPLQTSKAAYAAPPTGQDARGVHWVKPQLVAEVKFAQWTDVGVIRHASFIALREDKAPQDIGREQAIAELSRQPEQPAKVAAQQAANGEPIIAGVQLSHPDKVLFSAANKTKLDLANYYAAIEDWLMPHLLDRPLSLVRCPQGGEKKCFFQKHYNETSVEQIQQVDIPGNGTYMMANNLTAVIAMVQIGVLELHTWGSKKRHLMQPDRITIDLDPDPELPWEKVIEGAQLVKFLLEEIGLQSFVKTTGGKGLHVVAPIKPELYFSEIKAFTKSFAEHLSKTVPDFFIANMSKAKRTNKIFLDYLRNGVDATAIAAYSTRSKADGSISTPITWEELVPHLHADTFKLSNIEARLASLQQDPWKDYWTCKQRVTRRMLSVFNKL